MNISYLKPNALNRNKSQHHKSFLCRSFHHKRIPKRVKQRKKRKINNKPKRILRVHKKPQLIVSMSSLQTLLLIRTRQKIQTKVNNNYSIPEGHNLKQSSPLRPKFLLRPTRQSLRIKTWTAFWEKNQRVAVRQNKKTMKSYKLLKRSRPEKLETLSHRDNNQHNWSNLERALYPLHRS